MQLRFSLLFVVMLCSGLILAQERDTVENSVEHQKFLTLVNANREQSYVTFGSGIGTLEPLICEARLSPSYFFTGQKRSWALMLNPQVQVRMLNKKSFPIRNPSYKVYITFYHDIKFWQTSFLKKLLYTNALWYASVAHHSNGQDGSFYIPEDSLHTPNLKNGNFATNFLELGVSSYRVEKVGSKNFSIREIKIWTEIHPPVGSLEEMKDSYGFYRIFAKAGFLGPMRKRNGDAVSRWVQQSSIELKGGWIMGEMNGASPLQASRRLIIDVTYKYYPTWFDEIAFFLRFYRGQDYYNIYYLNGELTQLSIGITSNIMNFKKAVKYLE